MEVYNIPHQQIGDLKLETETSGVFSCYLLKYYLCGERAGVLCVILSRFSYCILLIVKYKYVTSHLLKY
jgi:hypothetical protein